MQREIQLLPNPGINSHTFIIQEALPVGEDEGVEPKYLLSGTLSGRPRKRIQLVERLYNDYTFREIMLVWQRFRQAGLPVPPTLRKTSINSLVYTDMKAKGSEIYGKGMHFIYTDPYRNERDRPNGIEGNLDAVFVSLIEDKMPLLEARAAQIANVASNALLFLPHDDPFELIVHPSEEWDFCILDLKEAAYAHANITEFSPSFYHEGNLHSAHAVLNILKKLANILKLKADRGSRMSTPG